MLLSLPSLTASAIVALCLVSMASTGLKSSLSMISWKSLFMAASLTASWKLECFSKLRRWNTVLFMRELLKFSPYSTLSIISSIALSYLTAGAMRISVSPALSAAATTLSSTFALSPAKNTARAGQPFLAICSTSLHCLATSFFAPRNPVRSISETPSYRFRSLSSALSNTETELTFPASPSPCASTSAPAKAFSSRQSFTVNFIPYLPLRFPVLFLQQVRIQHRPVRLQSVPLPAVQPFSFS